MIDRCMNAWIDELRRVIVNGIASVPPLADTAAYIET